MHTFYIDTTNTEENPNEHSCLREYLMISPFILLVALTRFLTYRDICRNILQPLNLLNNLILNILVKNSSTLYNPWATQIHQRINPRLALT